MENYKEKYEQALAKAKDMLNYKEVRQEDIAYIFPELKESEDEKIKKEIIDFICWATDRGCITKEQREKSNSWLAWLEKQGKQKLINNIEPKFKVEEGKWYVCISQFCNCIEGRVYKATSDSRIMDDFGTEYDMHSDAYKYFRLWIISDAKDGDVLYSLDSNQPFIYKERNIHEQATAYCGINKYGNFFVWNTKDCIITLDKYVPATKEQRDILMKAMADTGYTFDFEKKELKKNEQASDWSEEDIMMKGEIINVLQKTGNYEKEINWLKSLKGKAHPKQEWSEGDVNIAGINL